jgi:hypothetical protein
VQQRRHCNAAPVTFSACEPRQEHDPRGQHS